MSICINGALLSGNWAPLLDRLPGWAPCDGGWRTASSRAFLGAERLLMSISGVDVHDLLPDTISGPALASSSDRFQLCHASYSVPDLPLITAKLLPRLSPSAFFGRREVYDPLTGSVRGDTHLIEPGFYYITLFAGASPCLDHIGWWCKEHNDVDVVAEILTEIGWPVELGPAEVDGSYLVHFRAPDGRVHDFFHFSAPP